MAKSIAQIIAEIEATLKQAKEELAETEKRVQVLEKKVAGVLAAPASKRGVKVPQTPRPEILKELELGREPKGT
jgi:hypothetical protein